MIQVNYQIILIQIELQIMSHANSKSPTNKKVKIGSLSTLEKLIEEYPNQQLRPQFKKLQAIYPQYRAVHGDGNCFYRAYAYLYLCKTSFNKFQDIFQTIPIICHNIEIQFGDDVHFYHQLRQIWQELLEPVKNADNKENQMATIFNRYPIFDMFIVAYFRSLNYSHLKQNWQHYEAYDSEGQESLLRRVSDFGKQSQGIQLVSLPQAFNTKLTIMMVDKENILPILYNENGKQQGYQLFYRPGHYDIIYPSGKEKKLIPSSWNNLMTSSKRALHNGVSKLLPKKQTIKEQVKYTIQQKKQSQIKKTNIINSPKEPQKKSKIQPKPINKSYSSSIKKQQKKLKIIQTSSTQKDLMKLFLELFIIFLIVFLGYKVITI